MAINLQTGDAAVYINWDDEKSILVGWEYNYQTHETTSKMERVPFVRRVLWEMNPENVAEAKAAAQKYADAERPGARVVVERA